VGGQNLHEIDLKWWRSQIGLVQQEPFLFNDTIFKNVVYGLIGTKWEFETVKIKKQLVRRACKEAFADEFITQLPEVSLQRSLHHPYLSALILMVSRDTIQLWETPG
jgi:ATP-binding cassette subfamily B (MDR/TAP) protein 1